MNNYFCVLPFYSKEFYLNGYQNPCCLLSKTADISKIQQEMLAKKRPVECQRCWQLEDQGLTSDRQVKNAMFDFFTNKDINFVEQDCQKGNFSPKIIKLYTSNACNSTCVTCGPHLSTKWQSLQNYKTTYRILKQQTIDSIQWKEIVSLNFIGGEPFYESKNLEILENLSEINPNCFVSITTNGSIRLSEKYQTLFKRFKNLDICVSIDGIEKQFEYIRYPLKWTSVIENIEIYKNIGAKVSVSFTISNLNLLYYDEIVNWFKENNLNYNHNFVDSPTIFSIENLPIDVKKHLPLVTNKNQFDKNLFNEFIKEIRKQDGIKNIDIKDYLPELSKIIDDFKNN